MVHRGPSTHRAALAQPERGDDATEALADFLMGPGGSSPVGMVVSQPGLIGVVVRRGIDVLWIARPPIHAAPGDQEGEWNITVDADGAQVTAFSADDTRDLLSRLRAEYGAK